MSELLFLVEEAVEGGYTARAAQYPIFTEGDTLDNFRRNVLEAVECHFENGEATNVIALRQLEQLPKK